MKDGVRSKPSLLEALSSSQKIARSSIGRCQLLSNHVQQARQRPRYCLNECLTLGVLAKIGGTIYADRNIEELMTLSWTQRASAMDVCMSKKLDRRDELQRIRGLRCQEMVGRKKGSKWIAVRDLAVANSNSTSPFPSLMTNTTLFIQHVSISLPL